MKAHLGEGVKIGHRQRERKKVSWEQCKVNVKKGKILKTEVVEVKLWEKLG